MFPGLKRGHNQRTWIQCRSKQKQRTGATLEHTILSQAIQRKLQYRRPAAEIMTRDGVHAMTSIEHFVRGRIAVNPLHTLVRVPAQTIEQRKMALAFGRFLQLQCLEEGSYL
jgi:hypothetical protein